ncbi:MULTISPECIES: LCP family protein [unclassified Actinomyces]|uniref:LCP family protein n=1 Tax=unclassified Actinomyces TaxID=2609248 RepID=UPI00201718A6|nr:MULTISPECIES: LCP family protein [unclassified Actinomyces]
MPSSLRPLARHAAQDLARRTGRRILLVLLSVVLFATSFAAISYHDLQSQVNRIDVNDLLGSDRPTRADATEEAVEDSYAGRAVNILVMGSDTRSGANNIDGADGTDDVAVARSDTAMILHVSADRSRIEVVSIPRDTLLDIPSCTQADGTETYAQYDTMFNSAFSNGAGESSSPEAVAAGAACTIKTVEQLTGLYIDEYMVVDFSGLSTMVDALGGVQVYVDEDIDDPDHTGLVLDAGCYHMDGMTAVQYARVRYGVGYDGSDLNRIGRQQNLMAAMLRTAQQKNLLTSATDLYSFARSALATLTTSPGIGSLPTLAGLAQSIASIGMGNVRFVTMPFAPAPSDPQNRVVPSWQAEAVWEALINDTPVPDESVSVQGDGSVPSGGTGADSDDGSGDGAASGDTLEEAVPSGEGEAPAEDPATACYNLQQ